MTNATHTNAGQKDSATLAERARSVAGGAQARMTSATNATMDAAKGHPYAAAGIIAGVAAAVGGAAFAATRRGQPEADKSKTKH